MKIETLKQVTNLNNKAMPRKNGKTGATGPFLRFWWPRTNLQFES